MLPRFGPALMVVHPINRYASRRWKHDWITPAQPGRYMLSDRPRLADQSTQPDGPDPRFGSYVNDHPLPIEVFIAAAQIAVSDVFPSTHPTGSPYSCISSNICR
jgi:hypothetical protein